MIEIESSPAQEHEEPRLRALAAGTCGLVLATALIFHFGPWGEALANRFARPLQFHVRHWLGKDPPLDPRIRIFSIGDESLSYLNGEDLPLTEWAEVFARFDEAKPRVIIVDKIFGTPQGLALAPAFRERLAGLHTPIVAGAFVLPRRLGNRPAMSDEDPDYSFPEAGQGIGSKFLYGPKEEIRQAFRHVGHLLYDGSNKVDPLIWLRPDRAIPRVELFAARRRELKEGRLFLDDRPVPADEHGRILIDFLSPDRFFQKNYSFGEIVKRLRGGQSLPSLPEDAVLIVLPGMFTGHSDSVATPFGALPGGYLVTSIVNSVVTGQWLRSMKYGWILFLPAIVLGGLVALRFGAGVFGWLLLAGSLGIGGGGVLLFSFFRLETPWLLTLFTYLASGFGVFAVKARLAERRLYRLREELLKSEKLAALGRFSAAIAHEIKNPLAAVLCNAELAEMQLESLRNADLSAVNKTLAFIRDESIRATDTIASLMKFARQETPPQNTIDMGEQMRRSLASLGSLLQQAGVALEIELPAETVWCKADGAQLHEVMANLVGNAVDAMEENDVKKLVVRLLPFPRHCFLELEDNGPGIPSEVQRKVFEPFFTTKPIGKGTGLGLAICHGILRDHGGKIEVRSGPGKGACFRLVLPRVKEGASAPEGRPETGRAA